MSDLTNVDELLLDAQRFGADAPSLWAEIRRRLLAAENPPAKEHKWVPDLSVEEETGFGLVPQHRCSVCGNSMNGWTDKACPGKPPAKEVMSTDPVNTGSAVTQSQEEAE